MFILNGGPISWASRRQTVTALSTSEAELIALSSAAKELVWLRSLLGDFMMDVKGPTPIYEDNQATISIANGRGISGRTKHIDVRHFYVREQVENRQLEIVYCASSMQLADLLTKAVPAEKLRVDCRRFMKVKTQFPSAFASHVPWPAVQW